MDAAFVNPFLNALQNVLSMMAQIELKPGKPQIKKDEYARGDVSGIIGMVGPQVKGSFCAVLSLIWPHQSSSRDATILYLIALRAQS